MTVSYVRDAGDAVIQRTTSASSAAVDTVRYSGNAVLDGLGAVRQVSFSLPGGVTAVFTAPPTAGAASVWTYPNLHGDNIVQTDGTGTRAFVPGSTTATRTSYDHFGQPIDPDTYLIGTGVADDSVADTSPGEADDSWVGQHGKKYEHQGSVAVIEMGARQYVAALGRFLEVDPSHATVGGPKNRAADAPRAEVDHGAELSAQQAIARDAQLVGSNTSPSSEHVSPSPPELGWRVFSLLRAQTFRYSFTSR